MFPLLTDSHILGTVSMQVYCVFGWFFFFSHKISPACLSQSTVFSSWYNQNPLCLFCNVTIPQAAGSYWLKQMF